VTKPLISVVLPTYNRAYVLWRAIESVIDQTETRWELLVVDDGSTDGTARLLEEFRDERISTISTENRGPSAARNRGLDRARGEYVAYLDSDNTWREDFLEVMLSADDDSDDVLWYCGARETFWERTDDGEWHLIERRDNPRRPYPLGDIWRLKSPDTNSIVHRREVAETIDGWDEACRWLEDWDFFLRVALAYPEQTRWIPDILVDYRQVHGPGADGICAEAREDGHAEVDGRRYLLDKWGDHPAFAARDKLEMDIDDLPLLRPDSPGA
jgi:glycosyltransferase involved in cell wall biosynthesis